MPAREVHPTPLDASRFGARRLATLPFQGRVAPSAQHRLCINRTKVRGLIPVLRYQTANLEQHIPFPRRDCAWVMNFFPTPIEG